MILTVIILTQSTLLPKSLIVNSIEDRLRSANLSVTAQRIAVMELVSEYPHCTADLLLKKVPEKIGSVSKQAVYGILHQLSAKGLLRCIQPQGSPSLYETRVGDNHHHVICRVCNDTRDVNCATGETPCLTACNDHGFAIDEAEVIYWGICPTCQKAL